MLNYIAPATFECNELVVGATLEAFTFAKINNLPVLTTGKVVYYHHELIDGKKKQDKVATFKIATILSGKLVFPFCDKIFLREKYYQLLQELHLKSFILIKYTCLIVKRLKI